jgi:hypothetical protein
MDQLKRDHDTSGMMFVLFMSLMTNKALPLSESPT